MNEYVVGPLDEPDWAIDANELAVALRERWPGVRIGMGGIDGSTMALEALIPLEPAPRELGVALSGTGQAVTLDPADPESAAEFAVWMAEKMLPGRRGLHLIEPGSMRMVELTGGLSTADVLARIT
jgi:hypothetical protein